MKKKIIYKIFQVVFYSLIFFSFFTGASAQQTQQAVYVNNVNFPFIKGYYASLPVDYNSTTKNYPLLIFLHGQGELGDGSPEQLPEVLKNGPPKLINNGTFPSSFTVNGQTFSFIVISPQLSEWPGGLALDTFDNFVNYLIQTYRVDSKRVYLTGLSMGGGITYDYVSYRYEYVQKFAAIAPIAGASYPVIQKSDAMAKFNLPIWAFHNHYDPQVPYWYDSTYKAYYNSYIPTPNPLFKLTTFEVSGHGGWETAYDPSYKENNLNVYQWMLQYSRDDAVLPVQLTSFNAILKDQQVAVSWNTASEINNAYFTVERSIDGQNFLPISTIAGAGTSNIAHAYHYTDDGVYKLGSSVLYYRLRQTDKDGKSTFYNIVSVRLQKNISFNSVSPNPFTNIIHVQTNFKQQGTAFIRLFDIQGKLVYASSLHMNAGENTFSINGLNKLIPGTYILEIRLGNESAKKELLKK